MKSNPVLTLSDASHGKDRVRVAKVTRASDGQHFFIELTVTIRLRGGADAAFATGDNSGVVATDTCRNHVYVHAKTTNFSTPETFALTLAARFLRVYSNINAVQISVVERAWRRFHQDDKPHNHGFIAHGDGFRACRIETDRQSCQLTSALRGLSVLKTTQSAFSNFVRDQFTTLPETEERIMATTVDAEWHYTQRNPKVLLHLDFESVHNHVRHALTSNFFGPPDLGTYSPGLQKTLYEMGTAALKACPPLNKITLSLPNIHFLPCTLPVMQRNNLPFQDDVYIPSDEPHGIIAATLERNEQAKL